MNVDKVWVVMGNDFPDAVCASEELAEAYIKDKREAEIAKSPPPWSAPRIYWRAYPFQVRQ